MPKLTKEPPENLTVEDYIKTEKARHHIEMQSMIVTWVVKAFVGLLFGTLLIFFFQGFNLWGFNLDTKVLLWLGGATIGELAGLLLILIKGLFPKK